jgi:hypothetical protein
MMLQRAATGRWIDMAKTLGLTIPPSLLVRADWAIE